MTTQVADRLTDFTDRISPMLVKELRQGMRAKAFVGVFLGLQIALALLLLLSIGAGVSGGGNDVGSRISAIVFSFFAVAVLLVQPLRGTGALSSEIRRNTIDLMVLTRLSAWRIVVGKWFAIVSQSILLFASIVPYLILRYFLGGMELFNELFGLTMILVLSAILTAITVGLSGANSIFLRGIIPFVGCFALLYGGLVSLFAFPRSRFGRMFAMDSADTYLMIAFWLMIGLYFAWSALDLGATLIAPMAENRSTPRRLMQLGALAIVVPLAIGLDGNWAYPMMIFLLSVPALIGALTERDCLLPPQVAPFLKRKALIAPVRWLLYPGWASGIWFATFWILLSSILLLFFMHDAPNKEDIAAPIATLFGTLVFPALLIRLMKKHTSNPFPLYLTMTLLSGVVSLIIYIVCESFSSSERGLFGIFSIIPPFQWFLNDATHWGDSLILGTSVLINVVYLGALLVLSFKHIAEVRHVEHLAQESEQA